MPCRMSGELYASSHVGRGFLPRRMSGEAVCLVECRARLYASPEGKFMSARNGDKSRHAVNKRRVRAHRAKIRELVKSRTQPSAETKTAK